MHATATQWKIALAVAFATLVCVVLYARVERVRTVLLFEQPSRGVSCYTVKQKPAKDGAMEAGWDPIAKNVVVRDKSRTTRLEDGLRDFCRTIL